MTAAEIECGFLTYHPRMPNFPNIVRHKGQWMPEALITRGEHKRFSDAELMSEYHKANSRRYQRQYNEASAGDDYTDENWDEHFNMQNALYRFAEHPHFDEEH